MLQRNFVGHRNHGQRQTLASEAQIAYRRVNLPRAPNFGGHRNVDVREKVGALMSGQSGTAPKVSGALEPRCEENGMRPVVPPLPCAFPISRCHCVTAWGTTFGRLSLAIISVIYRWSPTSTWLTGPHISALFENRIACRNVCSRVFCHIRGLGSGTAATTALASIFRVVQVGDDSWSRWKLHSVVRDSCCWSNGF